MTEENVIDNQVIAETLYGAMIMAQEAKVFLREHTTRIRLRRTAPAQGRCSWAKIYSKTKIPLIDNGIKISHPYRTLSKSKVCRTLF